MVRLQKNRTFLTLFMSLVMIAMLWTVVSPVAVHAAGVTDTATYSSEVRTELVNTYGTKKYVTEGGGYYTVADLMTNTDPQYPNVWVINEGTYSQLESSEQTKFISDLNASASKVVTNSTNGIYTESTQNNWYKILQQQNGVGTKFMQVILENTKPDFVTANRIFGNFNGIFNTILGLACVLVMACIGVVEAADIFYITIPPFRMIVSDGDSKTHKFVRSNIITHDAIYAVKESEERSSNGSPKQALGIYLKRRIFALILLGICLMYLIHGQIYSLVGKVLDMVSGFMP